MSCVSIGHIDTILIGLNDWCISFSQLVFTNYGILYDDHDYELRCQSITISSRVTRVIDVAGLYQKCTQLIWRVSYLTCQRRKKDLQIRVLFTMEFTMEKCDHVKSCVPQCG